MTTTGAQYALAASAGAGSGGGVSASVGVDTKPNVVTLTATSTGSSSTCQAQPTRGQQVITVVTSPDPSSPNSLQPIQVSYRCGDKGHLPLRTDKALRASIRRSPSVPLNIECSSHSCWSRTRSTPRQTLRMVPRALQRTSRLKWWSTLLTLDSTLS